MTDFNDNKYNLYNRLHKKLVVLYDFNDIASIWNNARQDYLEDTYIELGSSIHKNLDKAFMFENWLDEKIILEKKEGIIYFNKSDLRYRGWTPKLTKDFLPEPNKIINLGRGRKAYYFELKMLLEIEESEDFLLAKTRKRKTLVSKENKNNFSDFNLI